MRQPGTNVAVRMCVCMHVTHNGCMYLDSALPYITRGLAMGFSGQEQSAIIVKVGIQLQRW